MITFKKHIFINRPKQEVFDFVSDPANAAKWRGTIQSAEWISQGSIGIGSRIRQVSKFMGWKQENTTEVTAWEPPNHITQKMIDGPLFEHTFEFQSKQNGTDFTVTGTMEIKGLLRLLTGLMVRQSENMLEAELSTLKLILEEN